MSAVFCVTFFFSLYIMSEEPQPVAVSPSIPIIRLNSTPAGFAPGTPPPPANSGYLYKKNNAPGLFWYPVGGPELDLTIAAGGGISQAGATTDRSIAIWDGETGSALQDTVLTISELGELSASGERVFYNDLARRTTLTGASAGAVLSGGSDNAIYGNAAGSSLVSANELSVFGAGAMESATSALNTSIFGASACSSMLSSNGCSIFGASAGLSLTSGTISSLFGTNACINLITSLGHSAFGYGVMSNLTDGAYNSAYGVSALNQLQNGDYNCAFGSNSGGVLELGDNNLFFGAGTATDIANRNNVLVIGNGAASAAYNNSTVLATNYVRQADASDVLYYNPLTGEITHEAAPAGGGGGGGDNLGNHTATQQLQSIAGSATAPGLTFVSDLNTGIYSSAADNLNITTAGTERLRVDNTGGVRIGGAATADAQAILHLDGAGTKGLLNPLSTTAQRNALSNTLGMSVVDSTDKIAYYNDGTRWVSSGDLRVPVTAGENLSAGDIVYLNSAGLALKYPTPWLANNAISNNTGSRILDNGCISSAWDDVNKILLVAYVLNAIPNTMYLRLHRFDANGNITLVQGNFTYDTFNMDEFVVLNVGSNKWNMIAKAGAGGRWFIWEYTNDVNLLITRTTEFRAENVFGPNNSDFRIDAVYCPLADKVVAIVHTGSNVESYVLKTNGNLPATIGAGVNMFGSAVPHEDTRDICITRYPSELDDIVVVACAGTYAAGFCTTASSVLTTIGTTVSESTNVRFASNKGPSTICYDSSDSIIHVFKDSAGLTVNNGYYGTVDAIGSGLIIAQSPTIRMTVAPLTALHSPGLSRGILFNSDVLAGNKAGVLTFNWTDGQLHGIYNYAHTSATVGLPLSFRQNRRAAFEDTANNLVYTTYRNATNGFLTIGVVRLNDYSDNFGVVQIGANNGSTATVAPRGSISRVASGLTPGLKYYINSSNPQLITTDPRYNELIGIAQTATTLLLTGSYRGSSNRFE